MKNRIIFSCFIMLVVLAPACRQHHPGSPPVFTTYEGNPILSPGEPGSWDDLFLWTPQIILYKDVFYLFYMGGNKSGRMAVGLAISPDGFHFIKFQGNPILLPDEAGFDSFTVGPGIVLRNDLSWLMYYNAQDLIAFAPGRSAGRATASSPMGPWIKSETPVLSSGSKGEWDAGFIIPSSVLLLEDGSYMMFYTGGVDLSRWADFYVGMATSPDGISWKKYNDPVTTQHPFAESDPVMLSGKTGEWDGAFLWMANVTQYPGGFRMYYSGTGVNVRKELKSIGYATSKDGIHWEKYPGNPVYPSEYDPNIISQVNMACMENPFMLFMDTACFMYYEYGPLQIESTSIGMATARY